MRMPGANQSARYIAIIIFTTLVSFFQTPGFSQHVISVRSGLISYCVGSVYLNEQRVMLSLNRNQEVSDGMTLRTDTGLAEIQLGAGAFLYANENTRVTMIDSRLENTVLQLRHGSIMIKIFEEIKDNKIGVRCKETFIEFKKKGLYRLNADQEQFLVYEGEAVVQRPEGKSKVKGEREVDLSTSSTIKFDPEKSDRFHQWTMARAFRHYQRLRSVRAENFRRQSMTRSFDSIMQEQMLRNFHEMNQQQLERQRQEEMMRQYRQINPMH